MSLFIPLTGLNLWFAYKTNLVIVSRTFNVYRAELAIKNFCDQVVLGNIDYTKLNIPAVVSSQESFIAKQKLVYNNALDLEPDLSMVDAQLFTTSLIEKERYIVVVDGKKVSLLYFDDADSKDVLKGFYHSCLVRSSIDLKIDLKRGLVNETFEMVKITLVDNGWDIENTHIGVRNRRLVL